MSRDVDVAAMMAWFDVEAMPKLGIRAPTMRAVIREALHLGAKSIFETGCVRQKGNWAGDGQSTIIWKTYNTLIGGSFVTCDISEDHCRMAEEIAPGITWYAMDSVKALRKDKGQIDLLYLDSFDVDMANPHPAALHALMELTSAMPRLHAGSIVFVDDSPMTPDFQVQGKGMYIAEYFDKLGVKPFTFAYQTAWIMP